MDKKYYLELDIIQQIKSLYADEVKFLLWFILNIIICFFWLVGIILTLYYLTQCHFIVSKTLTEFLSRCIQWIEPEGYKNLNEKWYYIVIYIISYVIIIFTSFVYHELIIINLWSLEKNTFKYISLRQRLEFRDSLNNSEENSNDLNTSISLSSVNRNEENDEEE